MILGLNEFVDLNKNKHNIDDVEKCETRVEFVSTSNGSKVETEYIYVIFKNKNKQDVKINCKTREKIEHKLKK